MVTCNIKPDDKKAFIDDMAKTLTNRYGKKKYYSQNEIRNVARYNGYPIDWYCWAYCFFCTHEEFDLIHEQLGEVCDYASMKTELLSEVSGLSASSFLDLDLSWLDFPDINWAGIFDWFDWN